MSTTLPTWPLWFYIPAALLAALGLIGLYCSLFKGRHKGRLRCRKCWYDMAGTTPPTRCPECGTTANTLKDLQRTRRHWRPALIALLLILPLAVVFARLHGTRAYYAVMPKWRLDQEHTHSGVTIRAYEVRDPSAIRGSRVTVTSNGKTVLDRDDYSASILGFHFAHEAFIDLNSDGVKEAVVEFYSGGAHCCYRVYIIELRPTGATIVADIDAPNGVMVKTPAVTGGETAVVIADPSFSYWKAPYATAPKPLVHYRLLDGALRVDLDRMDAAMTTVAAHALANESAVNAFPPAQAGPSPILWSTMLDMIYAGHEPQAWIFFDRTWRSEPGKEDFRKEFLALLAADAWYQDLLAARAARAEGKPIPPSIVGVSGRTANAAP